MVGIITRGDLVRALSQVQVSAAGKTIGNAALHEKLYERIQSQPWINVNYISLPINDGVVELGAFVESGDEKLRATLVCGRGRSCCGPTPLIATALFPAYNSRYAIAHEAGLASSWR